MKKAKKGGNKKHATKSAIESMRHCALSAKDMADTTGNRMYGKQFKKVGRICDPGDGLPKWRKR